MICLRGRVRFPIGGIVRERFGAGLVYSASRDLVQFQNRQYSLDERRCVDFTRIYSYFVFYFVVLSLNSAPERHSLIFRAFLLFKEEYMNTKVKHLVVIGMLSALAYIAVFTIRIPIVLFLEYEPKDVIIVIGGFIWGPLTAFLVSLVVSLLEMITISKDGIIGFLMNVMSTAAFACTASYIYSRNRTLKGAIIALITGLVSMTGIMIIWNYLVTPIYLKIPRQAVVDLLVPAILPFNLIKGGLNMGFTLALYKPVKRALRKSGMLKQPEDAPMNRKIWGVSAIGLLIVSSCVFFVLALNGLV